VVSLEKLKLLRGTALMENRLWLLKMLNIELPHTPSVVGRSKGMAGNWNLRKMEPENGHIAMVKPMKLQVTICGLNFASRFCNLFARGLERQDPFVLRAQPLDVNLLSHCQHYKYCFLKSLDVPFPCLNISQHF
jgi:hypothetical protein